jgi:hypothetical protein
MNNIIKTLKNAYYLFWADAIYYYNSEKWKYDWKFYSLLHTTLALCLFLMFLSVFVVYNGFFEQILNVDFLPGKKIEGGLVGFFIYGLIPLSLNYYLIFKDKKYENIILEYKHSNGKLVNKVLYSLLLIPLLFLLIGFILDILGLLKK